MVGNAGCMIDISFELNMIWKTFCWYLKFISNLCQFCVHVIFFNFTHNLIVDNSLVSWGLKVLAICLHVIQFDAVLHLEAYDKSLIQFSLFTLVLIGNVCLSRSVFEYENVCKCELDLIYFDFFFDSLWFILTFFE